MKRSIKFKPLFPLKTVALLGFTFMLTLFTGCSDDDEVDPIDPVSVAYVSLYHASPDAPPLDIYADNNIINFNPFEYTEYTGYLRFYTGDRELKFTPYNASNTLADTTVTFDENSLYSVFISGEEGNIQAKVFEDDIPDAGEDNALIRIVHLSPDAPSVDLATTDEEDDNPLFTDLSYGEMSDFVEIPAGDTSFELLAAEGGDVITTVSDFNFLEERVYTFIIRGFENPQDGNTNSLSVQVTTNFFNY